MAYHRDKWLCPDIWGERNINKIPCLETMGEYESAHTWSNEGLKERKEHPLLPLSMLPVLLKATLPIPRKKHNI